MQCPSCGNVLEEKARFCPVCGTKANANAQNVPVTPNAPNVQNAQYAPNAPNVQNAQYAPNAPGVQNAQYAPGAPGVQNAQYAPGAPGVQNAQYAPGAPGVQNAQYAPGAPGVQNAQYAPGVPGAQNVPAQPPVYTYGMQNGGQPFYPGAGAFPNQQPLTRKMFFSTYASAKVRNGIRSSAILCYISAALTGILGLLVLETPGMLLDTAILVVLGIFVHVKQSRVAAILLLVYSVLNVILTLVSTGSFGGWLLVAAGIGAVYAAFSFDKEYKAYRGQ